MDLNVLQPMTSIGIYFFTPKLNIFQKKWFIFYCFGKWFQIQRKNLVYFLKVLKIQKIYIFEIFFRFFYPFFFFTHRSSSLSIDRSRPSSSESPMDFSKSRTEVCNFELNRSIYVSSESSVQFLKQNVF